MSKDETSKLLKIGFFFKPFIVPLKAQPLAKANFHPDEELIVIERKGQYRAFLAREMAYHHVAQGEIVGEPYLVAF
jgi:hypothetical protein